MKPQNRTHRWAPAHPEEVEDRDNGFTPWDVLAFVVVALLVVWVIKNLFGAP